MSKYLDSNLNVWSVYRTGNLYPYSQITQVAAEVRPGINLLKAVI